MTVRELVAKMMGMPQGAIVADLYDGSARPIDGVYLASGGFVVVGPWHEPAYSDDDRPSGAPRESDVTHYEPIPKPSVGVDHERWA